MHIIPRVPWLLEYVSPRHRADGALKNGWEGHKPGGGRPAWGLWSREGYLIP